MPSAPGLGRGEHPATSAHVTIGGLAGSVGAASTHTRDTGHGATSAPGSGRGLMAGFAAHLRSEKGGMGSLKPMFIKIKVKQVVCGCCCYCCCCECCLLTIVEVLQQSLEVRQGVTFHFQVTIIQIS